MAVASLVGPGGPELIVVWGPTVSTVKLREAGLGSVLPAGSVARTSKVWAPSAEGARRAAARLQGSKSASWVESRRHSKLAPASEEKPKDGVASLVRPGGAGVDRGLRGRWCRP